MKDHPFFDETFFMLIFLLLAIPAVAIPFHWDEIITWIKDRFK